VYPKELDGESFWPKAKVDAKYAGIRAEVLHEFRTTDCEKLRELRASGLEGGVYRMAANAAVHDGRSTTLEVRKRWWKFRQDVQDSALVGSDSYDPEPSDAEAPVAGGSGTLAEYPELVELGNLIKDSISVDITRQSPESMA